MVHQLLFQLLYWNDIASSSSRPSRRKQYRQTIFLLQSPRVVGRSRTAMWPPTAATNSLPREESKSQRQSLTSPSNALQTPLQVTLCEVVQSQPNSQTPFPATPAQTKASEERPTVCPSQRKPTHSLQTLLKSQPGLAALFQTNSPQTPFPPTQTKASEESPPVLPSPKPTQTALFQPNSPQTSGPRLRLVGSLSRCSATTHSETSSSAPPFPSEANMKRSKKVSRR